MPWPIHLNLSMVFFLELYSGSCGLAVSMLARGFAVLEFDLKFGVALDLSVPAARSVITGWGSSGKVFGV